MKYIIMTRITWGDVADRNISLGVNSSVILADGRSFSSLRSMMLLTVSLSQTVRKDDNNEFTHSFSPSARNFELRGVDGTRTNPAIPIRILNNPSYSSHQQNYEDLHHARRRHTKMKIHAQPALPPMPCIFSMAPASSPEKAPES
jgi:hypothetical protein